MKEIWKDIKGFEGLFQVSNLGRVKTLERDVIYIQTNQYGSKETTKHISEKIRKPRKTRSGYLRVQLFDKDFYIHRLVCSAFIRQLQPKEEINHKDGNKSNNNVDNLEIVSRIQNQNHAFYSGLNKLVQPAVKVNVNGVIYESLGEASRCTGISKQVLKAHLDNPNKKSNKYTFTIKRV